MKKLLCYIGIILLFSLAVFPPVLRIVLPPREEKKEEIKIEKRLMLYCVNDEFIAINTYEGDTIKSINLKKKIIDSTMEDEEDKQTDSDLKNQESDQDNKNEEGTDLNSNIVEENSQTGKQLLNIFDDIKGKGDTLYTKTEDGELITIDFSVSKHPNLELSNLINKISTQKDFYQEQGLICEEREQ